MRRRGLTLLEAIIVVAILGILGVLLAAATGSSTNVARGAIEQADLEGRLSGVVVLLRRELRGAGVRRLTQAAQSPRTPLDTNGVTPPNWQDGDILLFQQPVQSPPGSGIYYDFAKRQPFWGADRSVIDGWNEIRFEQTDTIDESRFGIGGADLNGDGVIPSPPLRYGRLVKRAYGKGLNPEDLGPQVGPSVVIIDGVLDRGGTTDAFFAVTETASGEGVAWQLGAPTTPGRGGTVVVNLSLLGVVREQGQTRVRAIMASASCAIRPRNVE